jgi:ProP effector
MNSPSTPPRRKLTLASPANRKPDPLAMLQAQRARRGRQAIRDETAAIPPPAPPTTLQARPAVPHFVHQPADAETFAWNARREAKWHAEHAPLTHAPADPETLAHNQRKEAEWHAGPARVESLLRDLAPQVFGDPPVPLAIGVFAALNELLADESDDATIGRFLRSWTSRPAYLAALARGDVRRDLDGEPSGEPTDDQRQFELVRLARVSPARAKT